MAFVLGGLIHMWIAVQCLSTLVAAEFIFIAVLEMFMENTKLASQAFLVPQEKLQDKTVKVLFFNQGAYNGLIGVLILLATFAFPSNIAITCLMSYILLVALVGTFTSNRKIIFTQGSLSFITLVLSIITYFVR